MDTQVESGNFVLGAGGLPKTVTGLSELLQYARLSLTMRQGKFPYNRRLGSRLWQWERNGEHAEDRALALGNEALLWLPDVRAVKAVVREEGVAFTIKTPLGEGEIVIGDI